MQTENDKLRQVVDKFIQTVESTGGVKKHSNGYYEPEADPDWIDIGDCYVEACAAIGRTPKVEEVEDMDLDEEELEDLDDEDGDLFDDEED